MNIQFKNLGTVNKNIVKIGDLTIIFSYETPVIYKYAYGAWVVRQNDWSTTTGKLLNEYEPDKKRRFTGAEFEARLEEICKRLTLN